MSRRRRSLKAKPGELIAFYGYAEGEGPDLCAAWGGKGASSPDARCLIAALSSKVVGDLPFFRELEQRGYDLSTLKFTVKKKVSLEKERLDG